MSLIAEFTIPPATLPFGETLVENPEMRIEVERIVPTNESALPFFWVWGSEPERFMDHAEREPDVRDTRLLELVDRGGLFRAEWSPDAAIISGLKEVDSTIVESEGSAERWRFEVRSQHRRGLGELQRVFTEQGIPIALAGLYDLSEVVEQGHRSLTSEQRDALIAAYHEGYFDTPRDITQAELGERFGISHRAVSERLRRGMRNMIAASLLPAGNGS